MSKEPFTLYSYIQNNPLCLDAILFKESFDVSQLPDKVVSSKKLREHLIIDSVFKEKLFQRVFLNYFKLKIRNDIMA